MGKWLARDCDLMPVPVAKPVLEANGSLIIVCVIYLRVKDSKWLKEF